MTGTNVQKEYGDYQTPLDFSDRVCEYLRDHLSVKPTLIIEPTCGMGNFLVSGNKIFPATPLVGLDINPTYIGAAKKRFQKNEATLLVADFFKFDFSLLRHVRAQKQETLIIGNPPWVTNSGLSVLNSNNTPIKANIKGYKGLDAITGSANFDICEYIFLSLIEQCKNTDTTIAMLCKTSVARNVFQELVRKRVGVEYAKLLLFDARLIFDVSVDSGLFVFKLINGGTLASTCSVYNFDTPTKEEYKFGYKNGIFYSRLESGIPDFNGKSCYTWRQGIKHDCSKIMELTFTDGKLINGNRERVDIEDKYVYPLIKSSAVKNCVIESSDKYVIVTQAKIGADTSIIKTLAPKTWMYLQEHRDLFDGRKSSIYKNAPPFAMFGVGDYSFGAYKVGISGFYKNPRFALLTGGKPLMLDDTCYFINLKSYEEAYTVMLLLNSRQVQQFIKSISFADSKRPYTKKVLDRIDFHKAFESTTYDELTATEHELGLPEYITNYIFDSVKDSLADNFAQLSLRW
jgi:hypothetical protein